MLEINLNLKINLWRLENTLFLFQRGNCSLVKKGHEILGIHPTLLLFKIISWIIFKL